jgi:hypothetical protein
MSLNREEVAADLIWRYIEHLRAARADGATVELTRLELEQLVSTLQLAGQMPDALEAPESAARKAAVRRRLEELEAATPAPSTPRPAANPAHSRPRLASLLTNAVPMWRYRAAVGVALGLTACLATVGVWHRPSPIVKKIRVPMDEAGIGVRPVEEAQVHDLLPRMLQNELPPQQERDLMWHMLVCRGCFNHYVEMKHSAHTASELREELVQLVRR